MQHPVRILTAVAFFVLTVAILAGCSPKVEVVPSDPDKDSTFQQKTKEASATGTSSHKTPLVGGNDDEEVYPEPNPERTPSIIQLLAHPAHYHGKRIQVEGYLLVEFEGTAIYLSENDAQFLITENGFWVSFTDNTLGLSDQEIANRFHCKYVALDGVFDQDNNGHESLWQGAIRKVSGLTVLKRIPHDRDINGNRMRATTKGDNEKKGPSN